MGLGVYSRVPLTLLSLPGRYNAEHAGASPASRLRVRFARLRYDSGDWDYNPKVAANLLNSLVEYTTMPVYRDEVIIPADSAELGAFPFLFMTGHLLVRFSQREREGLARYVDGGGLLCSDDCNHDIDGLYARTFEQEMQSIFGQAGRMPRVRADHPLYR